MVGDDDKTQLQDMWVEIEDLVTDINTIHEWVDSTVRTTSVWFDQLDLTQTATKMTLNAIVS
jgi:hypothetical protein